MIDLFHLFIFLFTADKLYINIHTHIIYIHIYNTQTHTHTHIYTYLWSLAYIWSIWSQRSLKENYIYTHLNRNAGLNIMANWCQFSDHKGAKEWNVILPIYKVLDICYI